MVDGFMHVKLHRCLAALGIGCGCRWPRPPLNGLSMRCCVPRAGEAAKEALRRHIGQAELRCEVPPCHPAWRQLRKLVHMKLRMRRGRAEPGP